jgi:formate hydrogenlyase subunit 6/NADH:ubiquinone oxidoreductase subunit I
MRLTLRHLWQARRRRQITDIRSDNFYDLQNGVVTIQYPQETIAIPDNGRYRLHNEMDDCIVCDKCVKVCPVDCIEIEPIRAITEVGRASDGSPIRLYAARFDIDMAKCCYCGLCTTVCPTECLTMTKTFDYSELDVRDMVYNYTNLSPEEADEKRRLLEQFQKEKDALKAAAPKPVTASEPTPATVRRAFKPTIKPKAPEAESENVLEKAARPVFKPKKPSIETPEDTIPDSANAEDTKSADPKLPFRSSMKPSIEKGDELAENINQSGETPKPKLPFRPSMKPKAETPAEPEVKPETVEPVASAKPAFRPTMKPKAETSAEPEVKPESVEPVASAKPAFRPTMKPKPKTDE